MSIFWRHDGIQVFGLNFRRASTVYFSRLDPCINFSSLNVLWWVFGPGVTWRETPVCVFRGASNVRVLFRRELPIIILGYNLSICVVRSNFDVCVRGLDLDVILLGGDLDIGILGQGHLVLVLHDGDDFLGAGTVGVDSVVVLVRVYEGHGLVDRGPRLPATPSTTHTRAKPDGVR